LVRVTDDGEPQFPNGAVNIAEAGMFVAMGDVNPSASV
jgi:hypothetical protein